MKAEWRRFAPLGLYLALAALLAGAGLYFVQREWNLAVQISLAVFVLGLAAFVALDPDRIRVALTGRQARYGSNALVMTLAVLGIVLVVNYLAYQNPKRWDLTEDAEHTLASETMDTLETLPEPVTALAFYPMGTNSELAREKLDDYKFYSGGKFDYEFIDPIADPIAAREANVALEAGGTIVMRMGNRQEKVTYPSEQELTGALVRLMSEEVSVYFLTGHGEYSIDEAGEDSYSQARQTLEAKNYTVQTLNLLANPQIPADAQVIIVAGPRKPVTQEEMDLLSTFVSQGGSLIVMEEPIPLTDYGDASDPLADYLAQNWGVVFGRDVIVDVTSNQYFLAYAAEYNPDHAITQKMQRLGTAFPTARSVQASGGNDVTAVELVYTADQSWAETDFQSIENQQIQPDEGQDLIGRVPLAVAVQQSASGARVVAVGDADFAINANYSYLGNGDLFVNAVDWAAEQENLINLTPKVPTSRVLLQPQTVTKGLIMLGSVILPAGLVVVAGIWVAIERRKRG